MKNLIVICLTAILLPCFAYCQSENLRPDTIIYGNVQDNFPGGQEAYNNYLGNNGTYPEPAKSNHVQGGVYIRFVIEKDSTISNIHICTGIGSGTDEAGIGLIRNSGKWIPNTVNGMAVRTHCIAPIRFWLMADEIPLSKSGIYGTILDSSYFSTIKKIESRGIPVSEASDYVNKNIRFMGKIYETKALSDTVFIITCGNLSQSSRENYVNVVFFGKNLQIRNLAKKGLAGCLVPGYGFVMSHNGTPAIIVNDDTQYQVIKPSSKKFHGIYEFENQ